MLFRSTLEKHLSVHEGETALSDEARRFIFRGHYIVPGTQIDRLYSIGGPLDEGYKTWGSWHSVVRSRRSGFSQESQFLKTANMSPPAASELATEGALQRANHIERIARRAKLSVAVLLVSAGVGLATAEHAFAEPNVPLPASPGYGENGNQSEVDYQQEITAQVAAGQL